MTPEARPTAARPHVRGHGIPQSTEYPASVDAQGLRDSVSSCRIGSFTPCDLTMIRSTLCPARNTTIHRDAALASDARQLSRPSRLPPMLGLLLVLGVGFPATGDWPTYQHDNSRSGSTTDSAPRQPVHAWSFRSATRPIAAWDEPALWDGWSKVYNLKNRQVFDKTFHVAAVNNRVYFGSSVDDQVRCLDALTGEEVWSFFTEGPVRLAPTVVRGSRVCGQR